MIYSYLTPKYYDNAVLFLKSFKKFNGENEKIYLKTINIINEQIVNLLSLYSNLYIDFDFSTFKLKFSKQEESKCFEGLKNTVWMNYVADDHRIQEFKKAIHQISNEFYYVFADIDLLFRGNILDFIKGCKKITVRNRKVKQDFGKFAIGFIVFPKNTIEFVDTWLKEIQKTPLKKRQQAHGQLAFYKVIEDYDNLSSQFLDKSFSKNSLIWTPNKGNRHLNYRKFLAEYEQE
jgi:hypothetical protein